MEPLNTLNLWMERVRDRPRAASFGRFLWRRFLDDRLFQAAAALAYTTVFALVPLAIVVFGVLSAFPVFDRWSDQLSDYVFSNFVPSAARAAEGYLRQFSASAGQLTAAGFIALVISLLITLNSVEETFNQIWRVGSTRPKLTRFLVYWTVLTLGAMLAAASLAVSARVFALPLFGTQEGRWLADLSLTLAPVLIEFVCITLVYRVVPHHTVKWRHAVPGAILAAVLLEIVKWGIGAYLGSFQSYQKLYGTVAFVPILLLWIYLCWVAVLLGASLASSMAAFRYQPAEMRLPQGYEFYALLRLLGRFQQARSHGRGLADDDILQHEPMMTDSLLHQLLCDMERIELVTRAENGNWMLARDLDQLTLSDLYESTQLRIPVSEQLLPYRQDSLGKAAMAALDELRLPLREKLKRRVSDIYPPGETR
ncbi:YihY family inner membrane protein [Stenotrophomonas sp. 169]|uniref:YihY family inner membrane protein n=1 Tax=unclassified Stenotrophomonas TaxID=196198 RepID=UPI001662290C|nr:MULTISPECIES: YihY family inner membrane protein [unclassified Stenotrophomonas]MBD8635555.1 YihY family inner membrane protein [Stenotrophomonas sp. CFBP 13725]MBD8697894.1 YihY family inner membrane protein [Stenotrophomonas sp. CFBP 13718]QNR96785.1 YihY family inner membrane protein [Stenotrophomonas sp. 169]